MVWLPVGPRVFRRDFRFSPEDLYSNLLGARLAINVILSGHGGSLEDYNQAMDAALKQVLTRLLGGDARRDGSDVSADRRRLVEQSPAGAG